VEEVCSEALEEDGVVLMVTPPVSFFWSTLEPLLPFPPPPEVVMVREAVEEE